MAVNVEGEELGGCVVGSQKKISIRSVPVTLVFEVIFDAEEQIFAIGTPEGIDILPSSQGTGFISIVLDESNHVSVHSVEYLPESGSYGSYYMIDIADTSKFMRSLADSEKMNIIINGITASFEIKNFKSCVKKSKYAVM